MGDQVQVVDVTPRDGLQNESRLVSTSDKLLLIEKIALAGVSEIQATSFVHPHWVPQMADAEAVAAELHRFPAVRFSALVPNLKGYQRAVAAGVRYLEFVIAVSDTFNRKNLNRSSAESLALLSEVTEQGLKDGVQIRVGFSTAFHCPFEGRIGSRAVVDLLRATRERSPWRVAICDTNGMAYPDQVKEVLVLAKEELQWSPADLALHFHDTYGRALANTQTGLDLGVREFDATTAGLGGCPYCPGASGNLATEDLVAFLEGMGYETGIDLEKILDAAEFANRFTSRPYQGHLLLAKRASTFGVAQIKESQRA